MKTLTLILFILFGFVTRANIITVQFYSLSQPPQDIYLNICDTLLVNNTSGYSYYMRGDTVGTPNNPYIYPDSLTAGWQMGEGFFFDFYEINDGNAYLYHQSFPLLFTIHINQTPVTSLNATICSGHSFPFNGQNLFVSGDYQEFTPILQSCDSLTNLHLEVLPPPASYTQVSICSGESYTFNDSTFYNSGTYPILLHDSAGCDSIANLELIILDTIITTISEAKCIGDTYTFFENVYSEPGEYDHVLTAANGCDSIVRLVLSEYPPLYPEITELNDTLLVSNFSNQFGFSLNWMDCTTNSILSGETADFLNVTENGSYGLIVEYMGCSYYSDCYTVATIGLTENSATVIDIAPNPTSTKIKLKTELPVPFNVTIFDLFGNIYFDHSYSEKSIEIDVSEFAAGMYLLTVNDQSFRIEITTR